MKDKWRKAGLLLSVLMIAGAAPAQAATSCWNENAADAARVRDLQSRLMVTTLRCRAMGIDILQAYNEFVRANRPTIQQANATILAQFANGHGSEAQLHYDRFATSLANAYGADATDGEVCAQAAGLAAEAVAAQGDMRRLVEIEQRLGAAPELPGGLCPATFAAVTLDI
jgi:hypothetical protein